ncbi:MAG TPA: LUD domain-containing protein [Candidatus Limnocylindria bacterium]|nr:LUD domain-containing protein [Candidatus Limnocylindria bacterium]
MAIATQPPTATAELASAAPAVTAAIAVPAATPDVAVRDFAGRADDATIERTAAGLRAKGYAVHIVDDGAAAKATILDLLPEGAEVGQGASQTLEDIGVSAALEESGRFDAVRSRTRSMDRSSPEGLRAMRKLGVGPDWFVNSAHAVTEDGTILVASNTGSQLAPLSFGAGQVIFAIGSQKLVPDLATAFRRLEEHILPLENGRMQGLYGVDSEIKKVLIIHKEFRPGRFTIVLIKEPVGF